MSLANESDLAGFPTPRRVGVHEVVDADAEAGAAAVPYLDALAWRGGRQCLEQAIGDQFAVSQQSCVPAGVGYTWATNPRRTRANECKCLRTDIAEKPW